MNGMLCYELEKKTNLNLKNCVSGAFSLNSFQKVKLTI